MIEKIKQIYGVYEDYPSMMIENNTNKQGDDDVDSLLLSF